MNNQETQERPGRTAANDSHSAVSDRPPARRTSPMLYSGLVRSASLLPCMYPRDHCDKHQRGGIDEDGFTRCPMCRTRDIAQEIERLERS